MNVNGPATFSAFGNISVCGEYEKEFIYIYKNIIEALKIYNSKEKLLTNNEISYTEITNISWNKIDFDKDTKIKLNGVDASIKDIIAIQGIMGLNNEDLPTVKIICQIDSIVFIDHQVQVVIHCCSADFKYTHSGKIIYPLHKDNDENNENPDEDDVSSVEESD